MLRGRKEGAGASGEHGAVGMAVPRRGPKGRTWPDLIKMDGMVCLSSHFTLGPAAAQDTDELGSHQVPLDGSL